MATFEKSTYTDQEKYKASQRKKDRLKERLQRCRDLIESHKTPCLFCGTEENIEFHHVNALGKEIRVTSLTTIKKINEEVKKCWCLCRSCHTKLHQRLVDPLIDRCPEVL